MRFTQHFNKYVRESLMAAFMAAIGLFAFYNFVRVGHYSASILPFLFMVTAAIWSARSWRARKGGRKW